MNYREPNRGGLMMLVAYGGQDVYLPGKQDTMFESIFNKIKNMLWRPTPRPTPMFENVTRINIKQTKKDKIREKIKKILENEKYRFIKKEYYLNNVSCDSEKIKSHIRKIKKYLKNKPKYDYNKIKNYNEKLNKELTEYFYHPSKIGVLWTIENNE
uniref:Uncharacterized protein n=1 Tax=viral metagenome TaxID=1070528 RepID=A0A6C0H5Q4_9ZZZZ